MSFSQDLFLAIQTDNKREIGRLVLANPHKLNAWTRIDCPRTQKSEYITPLIHAIRCGKTATASFLISQGADVNAGKNGIDALTEAARLGSTGMVKVLLINGADSRKNFARLAYWFGQNKTSFHHRRCAKMIMGYFNSLTESLRIAAFMGDQRWAQNLINKKADVNADSLPSRRYCSNHPLAFAFGNYRMIDLFIESGANPKPLEKRLGLRIESSRTRNQPPIWICGGL